MAPVPALTMAALATVVPVGALRVETRGCAWSDGHTVIYPRRFPFTGVAVMFSEYAAAFQGIEQFSVLLTWKLRASPADNAGPANPLGFGGSLVLISSQYSGSGWKYKLPGVPGATKYPTTSRTRSVLLVVKTLIGL